MCSEKLIQLKPFKTCCLTIVQCDNLNGLTVFSHFRFIAVFLAIVCVWNIGRGEQVKQTGCKTRENMVLYNRLKQHGILWRIDRMLEMTSDVRRQMQESTLYQMLCVRITSDT